MTSHLDLKARLDFLVEMLGVCAEADAYLQGYLAGFKVSAEGFNFEYPFTDKGIDPEVNAAWNHDRLHATIAYIEGRWGINTFIAAAKGEQA